MPRLFHHFTSGPDEEDMPTTYIPPPIEPYRPEPRYTTETIVTSSTIIPTCWFQILSIQYDTRKQAHYYTIKSLDRAGDQEQPSFTRTVIEECLTSFEERRNSHAGSSSSSSSSDNDNHNASDTDQLGPLCDRTNNITMNTEPYIEVGDEVLLRTNNTGDEQQSEWISGRVVGMHSQHGLWGCFLVAMDRSGRTMPATDMLLKLVRKGTQGPQERRGVTEGRIGGSGPGKVRTLRPVHSRNFSGYMGPARSIPPNGICFGDAGKLG